MLICILQVLTLGLKCSIEIESEYKQLVSPSLSTMKEPTTIQGSLINARTLTDGKISELNNIAKNDHVTFIVEVNIASPLHQAIIENEDDNGGGKERSIWSKSQVFGVICQYCQFFF